MFVYLGHGIIHRDADYFRECGGIQANHDRPSERETEAKRKMDTFNFSSAGAKNIWISGKRYEYTETLLVEEYDSLLSIRSRLPSRSMCQHDCWKPFCSICSESVLLVVEPILKCYENTQTTSWRPS